MTIILSIISIFIFTIGALTFYASSEEAAEMKRYEALATSTVMILIGVFCTMFFLFGIECALSAVLLVAIALFAIHTIISYVSFGRYSFETESCKCAETARKENLVMRRYLLPIEKLNNSTKTISILPRVLNYNTDRSEN